MAVVPPQGLILVTGVNGFIGSVTAKTFLDHGYKVRGTVRSAAKHDWMPSYFGPNFSLVQVPDAQAENAFVEAVKGVDGIAHIAANVNMTPDSSIVEEMTNSAVGILKAAAGEPSVKRVVITSSANACIHKTYGAPYKITQESYNHRDVEEFKQPWDGKDYWKRATLAYCAAKTTSELKAFEWVRENKPSFVFNTVVPNYNMGAPVAAEKLGFGSSAGILAALANGVSAGTTVIGAEWYVHVGDTALLHLAALTLDEVQNERLLAFAGPFSWGGVVEIMHRRYPDRKSTAASCEDPWTDHGEVDNARSIEVLRKLGQDGFRSLEEAVVEVMEAIIAAEAAPVRTKSKAEEMIDEMVKAMSTQQGDGN